MTDIKEYNVQTFDDIKHIDENKNEFWYARELMTLLEYSKWQNFHKVIKTARIACKLSSKEIFKQFTEVSKPIIGGNGNKQNVVDYKLSRYACYLIVQNCDPRKKVIALAQTYFAVQTRKQELLEENYKLLSEEEKRFYIRNLTKKGNYSLNQAALKAGVKNFDRFHNYGYKGLYGGETADDIAKRKGLRYREDILDNMGSEELADNLFRIVQTESRLKNDNIKGESNANTTHYEIGKNVREIIIKNGSTLPEDLPTPNKSLKELENENKITNN